MFKKEWASLLCVDRRRGQALKHTRHNAISQVHSSIITRPDPDERDSVVLVGLWETPRARPPVAQRHKGAPAPVGSRRACGRGGRFHPKHEHAFPNSRCDGRHPSAINELDSSRLLEAGPLVLLSVRLLVEVITLPY